MKKKHFFTVIAASALALVSCSKVETGYVGLRVSLLGDDKGSVEEVPSGRYFNLSPNVEYLKYPSFVQIARWTEDDSTGSRTDEAIRFQSSEGLQIVADVGMDYRFNPEKGYVAEIFKMYRKSPEEIADIVIRNRVRDSLELCRIARAERKLQVKDYKIHFGRQNIHYRKQNIMQIPFCSWARDGRLFF